MNTRKHILFTGLLLGLAWAIRGHFGHEWGAAWAGAIGGMAILVGSQRRDWLAQIPYISALTALGWGVGGMMSYGMVIGYCRGDDFINVFYGYLMLAVIGGLYGCIGGGFLGLGLETTETKQPNWATLLTEMIAGGLLIWGLVIYQLEWFMTPPRSELWAACLGAALAMIWYMVRNQFNKALKVALLTMLGAAFGFSFGNFIQGIGNASGASYNWWNVMEFILGFSGGLAMSYAVVTTEWERIKPPSNSVQNLSLFFILLMVPTTNYISGFTQKKIHDLAQDLQIDQLDTFALFQHMQAWVCMILFATIGLFAWIFRERSKLKKWFGFMILASLSLCFTFFALIHKGFFHMTISFKNSVTLYIPILILALYLGIALNKSWSDKSVSFTQRRIWQVVTAFILFLVIITTISIYINNPTDQTPSRF